MRIAHYQDIPWRPFPELRGSPQAGSPRPQTTLYKPLHKGTPGQPGHFEMAVYTYHGPKHYPRHRHDFDQIRYTLAGSSPWCPEHATPVGSIHYVPAGTWYGPYDREPGLEILFVQFQGAGCGPFVDYDMLQEAATALAQKGTFENGVYSWTDEQGRRHNMDGHQAGWEYASGKKEEFPPARYTVPIELILPNFAWREIGDGVRVKDLGTYTEREMHLALVALEPGATHSLSADQTTLLFVTAGQGCVGDEPIAERDGIMLDPHEQVEVSAPTQLLELLMLGLPRLSEWSAASTRDAAAVAGR
jgi:hypothetical protein